MALLCYDQVHLGNLLPYIPYKSYPDHVTSFPLLIPSGFFNDILKPTTLLLYPCSLTHLEQSLSVALVTVSSL